MEDSVADQTQVATEAVRIFVDSHCDSVSYSVHLKEADFDQSAFLKQIGADPDKIEGYRANSHSGNKNLQSDFHVHAAWRLKNKVLKLDIEFVRGAIKPTPDEKEPFAEEFISWLEQFLTNKKIEFRVGADFTYKPSERQSKFPLPLKTSVGPNVELNIDGISFTLTDKTEAIDKGWLTQTSTKILVHVVAGRIADLSAINPKEDIKKLSRALDTMLEEKKQ
jgi:hypothetical protein